MTDQPETLTSMDHPVTRYVAYLLRRVHGRLSVTANKLKQARQHGVPDDAVKAHATELAGHVDAANATISTVLKTPLFRAALPEPLTDGVLQSLPDHPLFLAIHRCGRRLLKPGLAYAPGQSIHTALKHSYDLFEILVLYKLAAQLEGSLPTCWQVGEVAKIKAYDLGDRPDEGTKWIWLGPHDWRLELIYQARFQAAGLSSSQAAMSSLSAQAIPDFVLALWKGDELVSWVILDAKYRSARKSVHEALADIHRYRDSLRVGSKPASGAYIVVPHLQDGATMYGEDAYRKAHHFGALRLYAEDWMAPVLSWLLATIV